MTGATWLLFIGNGSISDFFAQIYVPFNCEFLVTWPGKNDNLHIDEVYRVAKGKPLNDLPYGRWNPGTGLVSDKYNLLKRRVNMEGVVLKAITAAVSHCVSYYCSGYHRGCKSLCVILLFRLSPRL